MATELNHVVTFSKNYTSPTKTKYDTDATNTPDPSFEKVYKGAEDKYVAKRVVYLVEGALYYDAAGTEAVTDADLENLFIQGVVCNDDGTLKAAISYNKTNGITFASVNP